MPDQSPRISAPLVPPALEDPVVAYFNPRLVIVFGSTFDYAAPAEKVTLKAGCESR